MENSPENDFQCLVTFWKCYFLTNFHIFSASKQILYQKIHHHPHTTTHKKSTTIHTKPTTTQHKNHQNTTTTTTKKKIRDQREKDWEIERSVFSGSDKIGLGWVKNEIGFGWWWREWDARLRSRWRRRWGRREKKEEAWLMCDLGSGAAWSRR